MNDGTKHHWEDVYARKAPDSVSWFQPHAQHSLDLIARADATLVVSDTERTLLAPSLTWTANDSTSLTLLAQIQRDDGLEDYQSLPRIGSLDRGPTGKKIDRDFFSGDTRYNDYKRDQYIFGYDFSHNLTDDLKYRSTARYTDVRDQYKGFYLRAFATDAAGETDYTRASTRLTAKAAKPMLALRLRIAEGAPVLRSEAVNIDPAGQPVEFGVTWFAGDRVTLTVAGQGGSESQQ